MTVFILVTSVLTILMVGSNTAFSESSTETPSLEDSTSTDSVASVLSFLAEEVRSLKGELNELKREGYHARTCLELMSLDPTLDEGMYYVDPDGWNVGDGPIYVHCTRSGVTSVTHDSEARINVGHCYNPGCYSKPVNYNATNRQINALPELSTTCQQSIRYDCLDAVFAFEGVQYAWWNDRNDNPRYYWSGSNDSVHTCTCGIENRCVEPLVACNCDTSLAIELYDEGSLTKKDHLPVTRLNFGRTSSQYASGEHTLGRLSCSGSYKPANPSERPTSCADLWRWGQTASGLYLVQPTPGENIVTTVFCDMTKLPGEAGQETLIGTADIKSSLVSFDVARNTIYSTVGTVTYENVLLNIGDAMNIQTGRFTAPVRGIYQFSFDFRANGQGAYCYLYSNSYLVTFTQAVEWDSAGMQALIPLEVGDEVYVNLGGGSFWEWSGGPHRVTHFTGMLVQEQ